MNSERWDALHVDIYAEISYHLGIDDSDDGACDAKNRAALGVMRLIERELADAEALASRVEAAWEWIARADPHLERNGDQLAELRRALSGAAMIGDSSPFGPCDDPIPDPGQPATCGPCGFDLVEHDKARCDRCNRPLPHTVDELRVCPQPNRPVLHDAPHLPATRELGDES